MRTPQHKLHRVDRFLPAHPPQPLAGDEIHLWLFPHWEKTRDALEAPVLRGLLASYLGRDAEGLRFTRGDHGKPRLAEAGLEFNLSHSGDALLLGVSRDTALGVDLETAARRTRNVPELAQRWFAPRETGALTALPHPQQQAAFLCLWTCKEAVLKCLGSGISFGLDRVEFELSDSGDVGDMCSPPARGEPWQVRALIPDAAHVGALAWRGNPLLIRAFVMQAIAGAAQSG